MILGSDFLSQPRVIESMGGIEPSSSDGCLDDIFGDALAPTLEAVQIHATLMAEQEQFYPIDSISRVAVPVMDFATPTPAWTDHISSPKDQFSWMRTQLTSGFSLPLEPQLSQDEKSLKWAPFPLGGGRVSAQETLEPPSDAGLQLLSPEATPTINSASYLTLNRRLTVLGSRNEEELEAATPCIEDEMCPSTIPRPTQGLADLPHLSASNSQGISLAQGISLESLISEAACKRHHEQASGRVSGPLTGIFPSTNDADATSKLLSGFMEMRAVKKPRLTSSYWNSTERTETEKGSQTSQQHRPVSWVQPSPDVVETLRQAPVPEIRIPDQKGVFMVSIGIGLPVLRHIESSWSSDHLLDRDYTLHNAVTWSPGTAQRKEVTSPLSFEADVSLTPAVGIIATTLLKAKQKPLPNSQSLPQIRERVLQVSQKYETLFVLVSESNTAGESMSNLNASDIAAYADFMGFTIALQSGVTTYFVPGADATLAKWILVLMCRFSPHSISLARFLNPVESTWEVFFRRAGMNVAAAQVLSGTLFEQAGNEGLVRFIAMSLQERMSAYSQLLGGQKGLVNVSKILDRAWS